MPESKKSPPDSGEWYEKVLNDQIVKNENKVLEEKINALEKRVEELSARPIGKIMYRPQVPLSIRNLLIIWIHSKIG